MEISKLFPGIPIHKIKYEERFSNWTNVAGVKCKVNELSDSHLANIFISGYSNPVLILEAYRREWNPPMNIIECPECKDVLLSGYRRDFKHCSCEACFVDGGLAYKRHGGPATDLMPVWDIGKFKKLLIKKSDRYEKIRDIKAW